MPTPEFAVALTGASGAAYGLGLVRALAAGGRRVHAIVSEGGARVLDTGSFSVELGALAGDGDLPEKESLGVRPENLAFADDGGDGVLERLLVPPALAAVRRAWAKQGRTKVGHAHAEARDTRRPVEDPADLDVLIEAAAAEGPAAQ